MASTDFAPRSSWARFLGTEAPGPLLRARLYAHLPIAGGPAPITAG
jgi:hypothetical protein